VRPAIAGLVEPISRRPGITLAEWVLEYLNSKRDNVTARTTLKSLKFDDVDQQAMRAKFNDDFGAHVTPVEMRQEFDKPGATVGELIRFLDFVG
jgi:hypothetical protein